MARSADVENMSALRKDEHSLGRAMSNPSVRDESWLVVANCRPAERFVYSGKENLETMGIAFNYNRHLAELIERDIRPGETRRILDFGAGSGIISELLRADGIDVECLEPDDELRRTLTLKGYSTLTDITELQAGAYDMIYTLNVVEHIEDDSQAIRQLASALKVGGLLLVYVPAFQLLYSSRDQRVGHYRRYRRPMVRKLAKEARLDIRRLEYCDPVGFLAAVAYRLGDHGDGKLSPQRVAFFDNYLFPASKVLQPLFKRVAGKNVLLVAEKA